MIVRRVAGAALGKRAGATSPDAVGAGVDRRVGATAPIGFWAATGPDAAGAIAGSDRTAAGLSSLAICSTGADAAELEAAGARAGVSGAGRAVICSRAGADKASWEGRTALDADDDPTTGSGGFAAACGAKGSGRPRDVTTGA